MSVKEHIAETFTKHVLILFAVSRKEGISPQGGSGADPDHVMGIMLSCDGRSHDHVMGGRSAFTLSQLFILVVPTIKNAWVLCVVPASFKTMPLMPAFLGRARLYVEMA